MKSQQKPIPVFVNELNENRNKSLILKLSAMKGDMERISQSLNMFEWQIQEAEEDLMSKDIYINELQDRLQTVWGEIEHLNWRTKLQ